MMRAYYGPVAGLSPLGAAAAWKILHQIGRTRSVLMMRKRIATLTLLLATVFAAGCVYQAALSQGNLLDQEDIDQVDVGMTRSQVRFLLGTPMIADPFHEDRWDYVYFLRIGREKATAKRWISVFFEGDTVSEVIRDQELSADL
jgi:outer membrane protein assembly factor BamE